MSGVVARIRLPRRAPYSARRFISRSTVQRAILAHGQGALGLGQHPPDDGAKLEQLQAAGPPQHLQQPRVDARQAHAAILCG